MLVTDVIASIGDATAMQLEQPFGDQRFHGGKPIGPTSRAGDAAHEKVREGRIDQFEIDRLVGDQMHREPEEEMGALDMAIGAEQP